MRVLVVDDDESIRSFVEMALTDEGYEVVSAPNGAAALDLVGKLACDVILLDMRMPIMDGWEFAGRYRQRSGCAAPIIVLTAARDATTRADEIDADGHLSKPFDLDELLTVIQQHTSQMDLQS